MKIFVVFFCTVFGFGGTYRDFLLTIQLQESGPRGGRSLKQIGHVKVDGLEANWAVIRTKVDDSGR